MGAFGIETSNEFDCRDVVAKLLLERAVAEDDLLRGCGNSARLTGVLFRREQDVFLANHLPSLIVRLLHR